MINLHITYMLKSQIDLVHTGAHVLLYICVHVVYMYTRMYVCTRLILLHIE